MSLSSLVSFNSQAWSCPAFFYSYQLPLSSYFNKVKRAQLSFFSLNQSGKWQRFPLQFNQSDRFGNVDYKSNNHGGNFTLKRFDRIALGLNALTQIKRVDQPFPCQAKAAFEISKGTNYGYLMVCQKPLRALQESIQYSIKSRTVSGGTYIYSHDASNHLSFDEIKLLTKDDRLATVAMNAEQVIRADVKNFFTMTFDSTDVKAKLTKKISGELGLLGLLQFYLKIWFFSIELALTPEVQFYPDSLYMPMSLHSPVEANKYLNKGSGIFYSWQSGKNVTWDLAKAKVPKFVKKGQFHSDLKQYCRGSVCKFSLQGALEEKIFALDFRLSKRLMDYKFYPQLVSDFDEVNSQFGEKISASPQGRLGVFFETSSLPKGDHLWDFWISFGSGSKTCPEKVFLKPLHI